MRKCFFVILGAFILVGCKSEQEKALDSAVKTQQLSALREFEATYPDSIMEPKVKADFEAAFEVLIKDSTYYEMATNSGSVLIRYNAATSYVNEIPDGPRANEMQTVIEENQVSAQRLKDRISELSSVFQQYSFVEEDNEGGNYEYDFQELNEYGQGDVAIKASPFDVQMWYDPEDVFSKSYYRLGRVTRKCTGKYYINDDLMVVLEVDEKRTYGRQPGANDYGQGGTAELASDLKHYYPTPPHRKVILSYLDDGFPHFTGKDIKNRTISMSAKVK